MNLEKADGFTCPTPTLPDSAVSTPSCRGSRPDGQRNIQESTFSISGECFKEIRNSRIINLEKFNEDCPT